MDTTLAVNLGLHLVAALILVAWIVMVLRTERPKPAHAKHEDGR
ncbi:hypothetical protein ACFWHW_13250 [Streptomyces pharetrae]